MSSVVLLSFQQLPRRSCCADEHSECVDAQLEELELAAVAVEVVEAVVQAAAAVAAVAFEQVLRRRCGTDFAWN